MGATNTDTLNIPKPIATNQLDVDVERLRTAFDMLDSSITARATSSALSAHTASVNPHGLTPAALGAIPDGNGTCDDARIGPRSADVSQSPTGGAGNLTQWISWFSNRMLAITGGATWFANPATSLAAAKSHMDSTGNVHGATPAQIGAIPTTAGSVTDTHIGTRTADPSLNPAASTLSGTATQWVSWFTNRVKAITGNANWWDVPQTTLASAYAHIANTGNPHSSTAAQVGAPTTTGSGASGTWGISITGAAASAPWTGITGRPSVLSALGNDLPMLRSMVSVAGTTQTGQAWTHYVMKNAALSTFTLPPVPSVGDLVAVTFTNSLSTNMVMRNGSNVKTLAEDVTADIPGAMMVFKYLDATNGWWPI